MTPFPRTASVLFAALAILGTVAGPAAAGEAEARQGAWRVCLARNFGLQAALTGRDLAADAAFRACRPAEDAYLDALASSPLLGEDDVVRARPALAGRIRAWLVGSGG